MLRTRSFGIARVAGLCFAVVACTSAAYAQPCTVPDNGSGTVTLPPQGCEYLSPDEVHMIIDGLPPGTTIELAPIHKDFICQKSFPSICSIPIPPGECEAAGGSLGGEADCFESVLELTVQGTGDLSGYSRNLFVPISCEVHTAPRNPGDPVQTFDTEMFRLQGELFGDPDFCQLRVTGGTDFGLPSPGQTTLTELPGGNFNVDSFFDIEYRIEFQGCPGSPLDGFAGATTASILMVTGEPAGDFCPLANDYCAALQTTDCASSDPAAEACWPTEVSFDPAVGVSVDSCACYADTDCGPVEIFPDGTGAQVFACPGQCTNPDDFCQILVNGQPTGLPQISSSNVPPGAIVTCDCPVGECAPLPDGSDCAETICPNPEQTCQAACVNWDPATGDSRVTECDCRDPNQCHVEFLPAVPMLATNDPCTVVDNGSGTVTLPPAGCDYLSPDEVHMIIDGLPAGTTIELEPIHTDFICRKGQQNCSLPIPPGDCEIPGGSLGGNGDCFESALNVTVNGTGNLAGFQRSLSVPVACEVHTGPRNPGDPVQTFDTDMFRLEGQLFGDPDFCQLRVVGGTDNGLPSPGHTTLTRLPGGDFNVDSFFDITYQIEFQGCPGSVLEGMTGVTQATVRMRTGGPVEPVCRGDCPPGTECREERTVQDDGTVDVCCFCAPAGCTVQAVQSCKTHNDGVRHCLDMSSNPIEPRGGITELDVVLDDVTSFGGGVTVDCGGGNCAYGGSVGTSVAGNTVTLTFSPPLPDTCCCTITLDCGASFCVCSLKGDVDLNNVVTTADVSAVKPNFGKPAGESALTIRCDQDLSGTVTTADLSAIKPLFGHTTPGCP